MTIKKKGLAALTTKKRKIIASQGGRAAHIKGTAHEFTRKEAKIAGKKGGDTRTKNLKNLTDN